MKKVISFLLALCMMFSVAVVSFAAEEKDTSYPYVFVHGMLGYGENTNSDVSFPYWGFSEEYDILNYLREKGYECCSPSVGPLSSAWDRACELYAQLTGTVVDYGKAHSEKYGHERYGRDYTGKALIDGGWDLTTKINIVTHSFGGPTGTVFCSLLSYGSEEEMKASPDDCSELFKGGHADAVNSLSTLASPHNGSPLANLLYDTKVPVYMVGFLINIFGTQEDPSTDFMMDQWGLTADPSTGKTASFNLKGILALAKSDDHCAYDMSLQGAKDLMKYKIADSIYLFSYSCDATKVDDNGKYTMDEAYGMEMPGNLILLTNGLTLGGVKVDDTWMASDGLVPVKSALYPQNAEDNHIEYTTDITLRSGVWYVMPTEPGNHGYHVSGKQAYTFFDNLTTLVDSL